MGMPGNTEMHCAKLTETRQRYILEETGTQSKLKRQPPLSCFNKPVRKALLYGRAFLCSFPYFIRKVSVSITSAIIAMTSIAFSYFVTDGLLHS